MYVLRLKNRTAASQGSREVAIPVEVARICTVCWTVHQADECPECQARQWRPLAELMQALGLEPGAGENFSTEPAVRRAEPKALSH